MTTRRTLEIAAFCAALLLAALIFHAWLAAHDDQLRLQSTLATQKQALDAADARERDRNSTLKDALAQIESLKRRAQTETPTELARALEDALHLPQPITITPTMPQSSPSAAAAAAQDSPSPVSGTGTRACANSRNKTDECLARSSDRSAEIRPTPLPLPLPSSSSTATPETASDSQQGIAQHAKSLLRLFRPKSPRTASDVPSSTASASPASASSSSASSSLASASAASSPSASASAASSSSASASAELHAAATGSPSSPEPSNSAAEIPDADLAPLYNYVQDCRACQLQLTAAKQNATDDAAKIRALTRERDAAVTAAKGGPLWLRLKRNAHWLAIGAALGAVASTAALCHTTHCR